MSDANEMTALPTAEVREKKGGRFPLIWLIPIVALIAGAFVLYKTFADRGPLITIVAQTAAGIEPGKTPIRFRDVQLGLVQDVSLSDDLKSVVISARMDRSAAPELRSGTQFWIESARITAAGVSGLGTLLSGVYIGMRPGAGEPQRRFQALEAPPVYQTDQPGTPFTLRARRLGSVSAGAPLYFRGIQVGGVLGYQLDDNGEAVSIYAFVRSPFDAFVREATTFWNASGIDFQLNAAGAALRTESLTSILIGGIAFDTAVADSASARAAADREFPLFDSFEAIQQAKYTVQVPFRVYFDGSVDGLEPGAPVKFNGLKLGEVTRVSLRIDPQTMSARIPVTFQLEPQRWRVIGAGDVTSPDAARAAIAAWVARGLRAQLQSGSLLTGQKEIALGFFPDADPAQVAMEDDMPVMPAVPSEVQQLTDQVRGFVNRLDKAQIDQLVGDARGTLQAASRLLASPSLQQGIEQIKPLLADLERTSAAARTTLSAADQTMGSADSLIGNDGALRYELAQMLRELTGAARSLRVLADFLERNPNAILLGKPLPEKP
jgi:paraquat-inducible protein B